jgi:hypothetical protein
MSTTNTPTPLLLLLESKRSFVRSALDAGKIPTPSMLASFLQTLVTEVQPHVRGAPTVGETLKAGLAALYWSVATNAPMPGSAPPTPEAVLAFLDDALAALLPDVATARAAHAAAKKALTEEERDMSLIEDEASDGGGLSVRQQKAIAASQAKLPQLRRTVEATCAAGAREPVPCALSAARCRARPRAAVR